MNYYNEIRNELIDNEVYAKVKDYSKNKYELVKYYNVGKLLIEAQGGLEHVKYGNSIIKDYSNKLVKEVGKKYNERSLRRIRQFYIMFKDEIWSTMSTKLSWSHYTEMLSLNDINAINYYINITMEQNLSVRELRNKIKSKEYERLPNETKLKLLTKEDITLIDNVKDPIIIKNKYNTTDISEKMLKLLILENVESFIKELGDGFSFIGSEYKIKIGATFNYIDLLLFNYKYNCFVVIELKITELKKEHIGQINTYMNYVDKELKTKYHNKTIGIIIVRKDNKFIMEYCSDERIITRTYLLI